MHHISTLTSPPQVMARVSWPALLKVLAVILVMTAAYKLFTLEASFFMLRAPCRMGDDTCTVVHQGSILVDESMRCRQTRNI